MSMGVINRSQKCQRTSTPNFLQGANHASQKCQSKYAPIKFGSEKERRNAMPYLPKGGQAVGAETPYLGRPHQFNRSHHDHAAMPKSERSTGRVIDTMQQCHMTKALPNQLQGVIYDAQQCHSMVAPTEFGPITNRRNANQETPNNQRPYNPRRNAIH